ncbi:hypothetical protein LPB136_08580 [Tenacibaculum todarodis]|uniref:Uncharacterized protein n=1 Tax=Tenacibaculum todarodis TaxID=1850252 RepID=A0A1L3JJS3_9FLAO|nr:hypothetical protein [Tenacibaculum todarodis]APG65405.1 hypothetical protein LPB136_08580 [Tenacibaculum todarodis]
MKNILIMYIIILPNLIFAQKNNWVEFLKEKIIILEINKTREYKIEDLIFDVTWNKKLNYSKNIGYYGGIEKLTIHKGNKKLQIIKIIEDSVALGNIYFSFYDYNFDGYTDFSIPINCGNSCWEKYYIFNPKLNRFEHKKSWDYLRIQRIDKKNKLIISHPSGNAIKDNIKLFKIKGMEIIEINT